jgi:hypothetical protein
VADVTDGTSATAAFSERTLGSGGPPADPGDPRRAMREIPAAADPTPAGCAAAGEWNHERGGKWVVGNYGNTLYNHALPPNPAGADCLTITQQRGRLAARSNHPGGVLVLYCDGGVRFARDGVSPAAWAAAATRAGGEVEAE